MTVHLCHPSPQELSKAATFDVKRIATLLSSRGLDVSSSLISRFVTLNAKVLVQNMAFSPPRTVIDLGHHTALAKQEGL